MTSNELADDADALDVDAYLERVSDAVGPEGRWRGARDAIVLGFFAFGKFLMYRDLAPEALPEAAGPGAHPLLAASSRPSGRRVALVSRARSLADAMGLAVRDRSALDAAERRLEWMAPEEIAASLVEEIRESFSLEPRDAVQRAARRLGIARLSEQARQAFEAALEDLLARGEVVWRETRVAPADD